MKEEDIQTVKALKRAKRKNDLFRAFVASKTGGNACGIGAGRSVILATQDGKEWYQFRKIWGGNNELRAREIVKHSLLPETLTSFN